ncbi:MAG: serine hydrolase [Bacilli bacterium]|jgi:D-alanyl-D-alanine carboxypeptidase|nr:serine hydrolase [Bacilli bacterium]
MKKRIFIISISIIVLFSLFLIIKYFLPLNYQVNNGIDSNEKNFTSNLKLNSKASLIMNLDTNQIIYENNISEAFPVYSCSKIVFLATLEEEMKKKNISFNDKVKISSTITKINKNGNFAQSGIKANEVYTIKELYYCVMMASGNDATIALAEYVFGSHANAVIKMNEFAKEHHLNNASFVSTSGLDGKDLTEAGLKTNSGSNLLSIEDTIKVIKIIEEKYPEIIEAGSKDSVLIGQYNKKKLWVNNVNHMIEQFSNIKGVYGLKTGSNMDEYSMSIINLYKNKYNQHFLIVSYANKNYQTMHDDSVKMINYLNTLSVINIKDNLNLKINFGYNKNKVEYMLNKDLLVYYPKNYQLSYYLDHKFNHLNKIYNVKKGGNLGKINFNNIIFYQDDLPNVIITNNVIEKYNYQKLLELILDIIRK